ncbi:bifunctional metallophosphatase/5'-nucleotidase [Qipengyuania sp. MTN3-11]|uniref:bifunctional metallophosphatase/5'-nucleotidase n=1 Tax=Qipengyuania sp. MTN3-11 TaxID=3056557 RepID=UPI0036F32F66
MIRKAVLALLALPLAACATAPPAAVAPPMDGNATVTVGIVGLNDFHGNLEPVQRALPVEDETEVQAGGAAYLASAIDALRARQEHSLVISAGDLISASPLVSSLFLDEPTVGAMNRMGLDFNAVGNHEFDRGWRELVRLAEGGCAKLTLREPCAVEPDYAGAEFGFLAANVRATPAMGRGETLFPGTAIRRFGEGENAVAIGIVGLTLEGTPGLVTPQGIAGLTFADEAETINAAIPRLRGQGADAVVVAIHQGLAPDDQPDVFGCAAISGPLREILDRLDGGVDVVISGHTHRPYVCDYASVDPARPMLVTSAAWGGQMLTDIVLTIDPAQDRVVAKRARNLVVANEAGDPVEGILRPAARADIAAYVARYAEAARAAETRPVGRLAGPAREEGIESPLGNLIADAQLAATRNAGAQIALMNPGGIRGDLIPAADGTLTFGQIYTVQPFGNTLITKSLTGAQLLALLASQFGEGREVIFAGSEGFRQVLARAGDGYRFVSATLDGRPIDPDATYRVTMNSFLSTGGDGFAVFAEGKDAVTGPVDLDAIETYLDGEAVRALPATGRIVVTG